MSTFPKPPSDPVKRRQRRKSKSTPAQRLLRTLVEFCQPPAKPNSGQKSRSQHGSPLRRARGEQPSERTPLSRWLIGTAALLLLIAVGILLRKSGAFPVSAAPFTGSRHDFYRLTADPTGATEPAGGPYANGEKISLYTFVSHASDGPYHPYIKPTLVGQTGAAGFLTGNCYEGLTSNTATLSETGVVSETAAGVTLTEHFTVNGNHPPTTAVAAAATESYITGKTTDLSVTGSDDGGTANLTYGWSATGPAQVAFSANDDNTARVTIATFAKSGQYCLTAKITDGAGLSTVSRLTVDVGQSLTSINISPPNLNVRQTKTQQFTAIAQDQFGAALSRQPAFVWSATNGYMTASGLFTPTGPQNSPYTVSAAVSTALHAVSGSMSSSIVQ